MAPKTVSIDKLPEAVKLEVQKQLAVIDEKKRELENIVASAQSNLNNVFNANLNRHNTEIVNLKNQCKAEIDKKMDSNQSEFDAAQKSRDELFGSQQKKFTDTFSELSKQVKDLLPRAGAVGLSKAFSGEQERRLLSFRVNTFISYLAIVAMFLVICFQMSSNMNLFSSLIVDGKKFEFATYSLFFIRLFALEAPLFWIAVLSNKKAANAHRAYEEYSHKYASAMTFSSMYDRLNEYDDDNSNEAIKKLNSDFINTIFNNPSEAIDRKRNIETPFTEINNGLKNIASILENKS